MIITLWQCKNVQDVKSMNQTMHLQIVVMMYNEVLMEQQYKFLNVQDVIINGRKSISEDSFNYRPTFWWQE